MEHNSEDQQRFDEPSLEDFLVEEIDPSKEKWIKRRKNMIRSGAAVIALVFLISTFSVFSTYINLPAMEFLKISFQLSQRDDIKRYKRAVVAVEGNNVKGTGFNISKEGYIITNFHVIEDMKQILVHFSDGHTFKAKVDKKYPNVDLAFLEIAGENLPELDLAKGLEALNGEKVFVIGNPLAFYQIANRGKMIGLREVNGIEIPVLEVTAPVYRGNSGSPVIDEEGKVVAVVFASTIPKVNSGEAIEGLAIPIDEVVTRLPSGLEE
ncbi:serine protease [Bacillus sp. DNRA2]|uniref:S1C family serine protease n=1 Tax=Bacillus sp. DNRA2 TaxID=2723053 RepID=UPI00145C8165|nr:serine protease [Bacillus sp. DNRA2]NMD71620.1 serine protease [Bacillus sp. DNRA2]